MRRKHSNESSQVGRQSRRSQAKAGEAQTFTLSLRPLARCIRQASLPAGLMLAASAAMAGPQGGNVVVVLSVVCVMGTMALFDVPVMLPTQILPSFLLAVGVGAVVHILVDRAEAAQGLRPRVPRDAARDPRGARERGSQNRRDHQPGERAPYVRQRRRAGRR